ncbi:hypothetical protein B0J11DRAFT_327023 [Dendryphion nanum]|uniref:Uncharacterized protein n=1 Tax=Dendryphion nanum TaxID=256645 RepID=A0A9P9IJ22_9PLEO|nr:hypothetical protein B0J11DRAFT_327023 [Dendryphion nanum]
MSFLEEILGIGRSLFSDDPFRKEREEALKYAARHPEIKPAKIETPEQLHARYTKALTRSASLSQSGIQFDKKWIELLFKRFCVQEWGVEYWTKESLSQYLDAIFIPDATGFRNILMSAVPALYTLLLRLGSFPFHLNPLSKLTFDVFSCAIIIINFRDSSFAPGFDKDYPGKQEARFRKLLFQGLLISVPPVEISQNNQTSGAVDESVMEALRLIEKFNYWRSPDFPKLRFNGPELPFPQDFPRYFSGTWSGSIAPDSISPLITLLLAIQLSPESIGPEHLTAQWDELSRAAKAMTAGLTLHKRSGMKGIIWDGFDISFRDHYPNLLYSFDRLFRPAVHLRKCYHIPLDISTDQLDYHKTFNLEFSHPSSGPGPASEPEPLKLPVEGSILTLPLLAQLATFLPTNLRLNEYRLTTFQMDSLTTAFLNRQIQPAASSSVLLLVSGHTESNHLSLPITVGVFIQASAPPKRHSFLSHNSDPDSDPPNRYARLIFQTYPIHQVFRPSLSHQIIPRSASGYLHVDTLDEPTGRRSGMSYRPPYGLDFWMNPDKHRLVGEDWKYMVQKIRVACCDVVTFGSGGRGR